MKPETVDELAANAAELILAPRTVVSVRLAGIPAGWWKPFQPFQVRLLFGNAVVCTCTRTVNGRMTEAIGKDQEGTRYVISFPDALPELVFAESR